MSSNNKLYNFALIGDPVGHSLSPSIHAEFFKKSNLKGSYVCIQTDINKLKETLNCLITLGFTGANITVPHKQKILEFVDFKSQEVELIGACNTLIFKNNKIFAYNTDCSGFWNSINLKYKQNLKKVLIIGAGGSARAVTTAFAQNFQEFQENNFEISFLVKNQESSKQKAQDLIQIVQKLNKNIISNIYTSQEIIAQESFDIIVNTSPVGMEGCFQGETPVSEINIKSQANKNCIFYDLVYKPEKTEFLRLASSYNFPCQNGLDMLINQAKLSFEIWTDINLNL